VGAVVGVYSIMQFFFAPVWGRLSDRIGRRPVILASLTASCIGYLLFAFANNLTLLFVSRIIAGAGGANISTAQAYITDMTTPERRAKGMGLIGAAFGLGFILGPPLSGILAAVGTSYGWHGNLLPGLAAGALSFTALMVALFVLAESKPAGAFPRSRIPPQFDPRLWREMAHHALLFAVMSGLFFTLLAVAGMETSVTLHVRDRFNFRQIDLAYLFLFMGVIVAAIQ
jgi:MFS family permease